MINNIKNKNTIKYIINIFIYGENTVTLLNVINFYNSKFNKNTKINFKLGSLLPNNNYLEMGIDLNIKSIDINIITKLISLPNFSKNKYSKRYIKI